MVKEMVNVMVNVMGDLLEIKMAQIHVLNMQYLEIGRFYVVEH